jgi:peptidoglycan/LPS O-acetylase OafA/YrhL
MPLPRRVFIIDFLRAFAALIVLNSHASIFIKSRTFGTITEFFTSFFIQPFWNLTGVHPGVVIFITLSGFLIHYSNSQHPTGYFSNQYWYQYFLKRTIRIFPVLICAMLAGIVALYFYNNAWPGINILPAFFTPFFANNASVPGNEILNTVITEYWIYLLIYPLFILTGKKKVLLFIALIVYLLNFSRGFFSERSPEYKTWLGINFYTFQLFWLIGAFFCDRSAQITRYFSNKRIAILAHCFFIGFILLGNIVFFKGKYIISNILFSILISFYVVYFRHIKGYFNSIVHFFSDRVFTIYAIHFPLLILYKILFLPFNNQVSDLLLLPGIFLCVELVYQFIEKPSHKWARIIGHS